MATSGTVATTRINTAKVLDHAMRRCGIPAAMQTPETVEIGRENLYLILLNLANRGLNLWCVERVLLGLTADKATYDLPDGTVQLLNVLFSVPTQEAGTDTAGADNVVTELDAAAQIVRWGFKLTAGVTGTMTLASSDDGIAWTTVQTLASEARTTDWYWQDIDPPVTAQYWRVTSSVAATFDEFYLASQVRDWPMTQFNRDEYTQQPNKDYSGTISTNYYYDRTIAPTITLWPVADSDYNHLSIWRHRFVEDVGTLVQEIEVPQMWYESIIWMLAARLAYELPNADPARRKEVIEASAAFLQEAELGETDNAPVYWVPGIGVYTS
jgi:hypothetical protein